MTERKRRMKTKRVPAFVLALLTASALALTASAEFLPEEKENYNATQVMTAENGGNGFSFYAQRGETDPELCKYEVGQWDSSFMISRIDEDPTHDVSAMFWVNDPKGSDAYMLVTTSGGDLIVDYKSPVAGKVSFNFEAALTEHTVAEGENGILLSVERADGTKLCDGIDINVIGTQEWGNYKKSGTDALGKATFTVDQDEEIRVRFSNKGNGMNDTAIVWWDIRYSKIGEAETTNAPVSSADSTSEHDTKVPESGTNGGTAAPSGTDTAAPKDSGKTNPAVIAVSAACAVIAVAVVVVAAVKSKKKK